MGAAGSGSRPGYGKLTFASNARPWLTVAAVSFVVGLPMAGLTDEAAGDKGGPVTFLEQGWSPEIRAAFYHTPQGSRMIPYGWFMALEAPDGAGMFHEDALLARYGLIPTGG